MPTRNTCYHACKCSYKYLYKCRAKYMIDELENGNTGNGFHLLLQIENHRADDGESFKELKKLYEMQKEKINSLCMKNATIENKLTRLACL